MNEKINLQDLAALIAEKSSIDQKDTEVFLKELIETVQEALLSEDSVRIKNLGTFKRIAVSDRESVDVATGNRVVIPAHYKIGFTPDNNLAHAVNEPFALFDTVELDDTVPLKDTKEIENPPTEESSSYTQTTTDPEKPAPPASYRELPHYKKTKKRNTKNKWATYASTASILLLIALLVYLILDSSGSSKDLIYNNPATIPQIAYNEPVPSDSIAVDSVVVKNPTTKAISKSAEKKTTGTPAVKTDTGKKTDLMKQYKMRSGDRLTVIALNEYGNKVFWVYLYEENKNSIRNPNIVPAGTVIQIPPAAKYGINKDDPASVRKATDLQQKYNKINY